MVKNFLFLIAVISFCITIGAENLFKTPELGKMIEMGGRNYDTFYYFKGEPQYLLQKYDRISIPHSVNMVSLRNLDINGIFLRDLIGEVTDIHGTVKAHSIAIHPDDREAWVSIRNALAEMDIPAWPVVTYHAPEPFILDGKMNLYFYKWTSLKEQHEIFNRFDLEVVEICDRDPGFYTVALPTGSDPFEIANTLVEKNLVRWAQPNWYWHLETKLTPNDPYYNLQWHLPQIIASHAWDTETGEGKNAKIAIVDSGVDTGHPDLNVLAGWNFINNNDDPNPTTNDQAHGTAVAGLAAAKTNNNLGVAGVCWGCPIIPIKLIGGGWGTYPTTIRNALQYAVDQGAWVVNNSWGPPGKDNWGNCVSSPADNNQAQAVDYGRINGRDGKGTVMVWASGNDNCNTNLQGSLKNNDLFAISALDSSGSKAFYSNYGWEIDLAAGAGAYTTDTRGTAGYNSGMGDTFHDRDYTSMFSGTSAAAPVAAGAIALMIAANTDLTFSGIMNCAKASAAKTTRYCSQGDWVSKEDPYLLSGSKDHSPCYGFGIVDAHAMVNGAKDGTCGECIPTSEIDLCYGEGYGRDDNCDGTIDTDCENGGIGRAGHPCSKSSECLNTAKDPMCITDWPGGYCSAECEKNADCYNGNTQVECYLGKCIAKCGYSEIRSGYDCISNMILPEGSEVEAYCGNGIREGDEVCDGGYRPCTMVDSSFTGGTAPCRDDCKGWDTSNCEGGGENLCGNGNLDPGEICDGDVLDCSQVAGAKPYGKAPCKDDCSGWDTSGCYDDPDSPGNGDNGNGEGSGSGPVCGNGILEVGEECDDGNRIDGDGCSANCLVERGYVCTGSPSVCKKKSSGGCSLTIF